MLKRTWALLVSSMVFVLAACEDEGNAGDDNLLTGGSLVILILIAIGIFLFMRRRR